MPRSLYTQLWRILLLALIYAASGKAALLLAIPPGYATAIFPPSGIALAAVLVWGWRVAPGVWLGSWLLNLWLQLASGQSVTLHGMAIPAIIGVGASLQTVAAAAVLQRLLLRPLHLDNARDILRFLLVGCAVGACISPSVGVTLLWWMGLVSSSAYVINWTSWWIGDALGVVIATPLTLLLISPERELWRRRRWVLSLSIGLVASLVIVVFVRTSAWEQERVATDLSRRAEQLANDLGVALRIQVTTVKDMDLFLLREGRVDEHSFLRAVHAVEPANGGPIGLGWAQQLPTQGDLAVASTARAEPHAPILYAYPAAVAKVRGFDLYSEARRRDTLQRSAATGRIALSEPIPVMQYPAAEPGFLIAQAMFSPRPAGEGSLLQGFCVGVIHPVDTLRAILSEQDKRAFDWRLEYLSAGGARVLGRSSAGAIRLAASDGDASSGHEFPLADGHLRLLIEPQAAYLNGQRDWYAWCVLATGLCLTGLLGAFVLLTTGHASRIENLVVQRTQELKQAKVAVERQNRLLLTIDQAQAAYIGEQAAPALFQQVLQDMRELTASEHGFIGQFVYEPIGVPPYLKALTISEGNWAVDGTRVVMVEEGILLSRLDGLFGNAARQGQTLILDHTEGTVFPGLNNLLALPLGQPGRINGVLVLANSAAAYDADTVRLLGPLRNTCAQLIDAYTADNIRERMESDLRDSETRLRVTLDSAPDAIITVSEAGYVQTANIATEALFGYPVEQLAGKVLAQLIPGLAGELDAWIIGAQGQQTECLGRHADGGSLPLELSAGAIKMSGKRRWVIVLHDLRERKRVERMKNEFVAIVSHELRTPLTSIRGALGLLVSGLMDRASPQAGQLLNLAHQNTLRLTHLVNDLLDVEKLEYGSVTLQCSPQPLAPLVEQAIESSLAFAERCQVQVQLEQHFAEEAQASIVGERLLQVLANLLSNAIKFSPAGGTVTVNCNQAQGRLRLTIADQGPGIGLEFRERVFQKFAQADGTSTRKHPGTGLGLAISKILVERMGGQIGFDCPPGGGSCFWVDFADYH